jgi:acylphosphatase
VHGRLAAGAVCATVADRREPGSLCDDGEVRTVRVTVTGRVQGVFFRASCAERARDLGLTGWVRNVGGGGLEALFHGSDDAVEAIVAWCRDGPPMARVDRVEVRDEPPYEGDGFRVAR